MFAIDESKRGFVTAAEDGPHQALADGVGSSEFGRGHGSWESSNLGDH